MSEKKDLKICMGLNCSRNYSKEILKKAKKHQDVNVSASCCMGMCSEAPTIMINGKIITKVNPNQLDSLLGKKSNQTFKGAIFLDDNGLESIADLLDI